MIIIVIISALYSYESSQNETTPTFLYLMEIKDLRVLENSLKLIYVSGKTCFGTSEIANRLLTHFCPLHPH